MSTTGYIVFAHGSSVESANDAVSAVARKMAEQGGFSHVEAAFLEGGRPDLRAAAEALAGRGVTRIIVVPYFLTMGMHLQRDLPNLIQQISALYPQLDITAAPPLDGHPAMVEVLIGRAREAELKHAGNPR
jgi:sirohydrochlorin ferrochelatase